VSYGSGSWGGQRTSTVPACAARCGLRRPPPAGGGVPGAERRERRSRTPWPGDLVRTWCPLS